MHRSIKHLQNEIQVFESKGYGKNRPSRPETILEENIAPGPEKNAPLFGDDQQYRFSVLERFLGDLDGASQGRPSVANTDANVESGDEEEESQDWTNNIKKLDPWGIVCTTKTMNVRPSVATEDDMITSLQQADDAGGNGNRKSSTGNGRASLDQADVEGKEVMSEIVSSSSSRSDPEDMKYAESDEAETLAEIYHSYATAFDKHATSRRQSDDPVQRSLKMPIHHLYRHTHHWKNDITIPADKEMDTKFLSVAQPPKGASTPTIPSKLGEMMGWSRYFCNTNTSVVEDQPTTSSKSISLNKPSIFPKPNWSQFTELYNEDDDADDDGGRNVDPCLQNVDFYSHLKWQDDDTKNFPISPKDESFLLDYEMARIARKMENDDPGFMFEFLQKFENATPVEKDGICGQCKKWKKPKSSPTKRRIDAATSTTELDVCQCEDDCPCDLPPPPWSSKSSLRQPGKMTNWTKDYAEYPGEYEVGGGEGDYAGKMKSKKSPTTTSLGQFLHEFMDMEDVITQVKSSCECGLDDDDDDEDDTLLYPDECEHYCKISAASEEDDGKEQRGRQQSNVVKRVSGDGERRTSIDPELERSFRESGGYAMVQELKQRQRDKASSISQQPQNDLDAELQQPKFPSEVYETLDLNVEVKKAFGID
ncbi:uncharacterized protein LOC118438405 [Folsomia candida]|nr:uncharacterized protein LOC118438405 [Folsomia candida]